MTTASTLTTSTPCSNRRSTHATSTLPVGIRDGSLLDSDCYRAANDRRQVKRHGKSDGGADVAPLQDKPAVFARASLFFGRVTGSRAANVLAVHPIGPLACDCWKVALVTAGSVALTVAEAGRWELQAGDLAILRRGATYTVTPITPAAATIVYIDQVFIHARLAWLLDQPENREVVAVFADPESWAWTTHPDTKSLRSIGQVFASISHSRTSSHDGGAVLNDLARLLDVLEVVREVFDPSEPAIHRVGAHLTSGWPSARSEVIEAARLLFEQMDEDWSLHRLSSCVNVSPSHLSALFRTGLGAAPMSYLRELRVQKLAFLLITSDTRISELARNVGWRDPEYAGRLFRRRFGMSPRAYRAFHAAAKVDTSA